MPTTTVTCLPQLTIHWQLWDKSPIEANRVTIFRLKLPDNEQLVSNWHALLQAREQQRAAKFRQSANRNAFILGRGLFRIIAGQITGQSPQQVTIDTSYTGKPYLAHAPNWHLSVSHTGDWVVVAVAQVPVGIDVEYVNPRFIIDDLIPAVLTPDEQRTMTKSTNARLLFYELWTRKEALVKATGKGMDDDFINVPGLEGRHVVDSDLIGDMGPWQVQPFVIADSYQAALAYVYEPPMQPHQFYDVSSAIIPISQ